MSNDLVPVKDTHQGDEQSERRVNFAELFQTLGELRAAGEERRAQTSELFRLQREMASSICTKADLQTFMAFLQEHDRRDVTGFDELHKTVHSLSELIIGDEDKGIGVLPRLRGVEETQDAFKTHSKRAIMFGIGLPSFVVSCIELYRYLRGP